MNCLPSRINAKIRREKFEILILVAKLLFSFDVGCENLIVHRDMLYSQVDIFLME